MRRESFETPLLPLVGLVSEGSAGQDSKGGKTVSTKKREKKTTGPGAKKNQAK